MKSSTPSRDWWSSFFSHLGHKLLKYKKVIGIESLSNERTITRASLSLERLKIRNFQAGCYSTYSSVLCSPEMKQIRLEFFKNRFNCALQGIFQLRPTIRLRIICYFHGNPGSKVARVQPDVMTTAAFFYLTEPLGFERRTQG